MKKIKYVLILFIVLISFDVWNIHALEGGNESGNVSGMSDCSNGWCVNNERYGVRFSLVDKNGNLIGSAVDIFYLWGTAGNKNVTPYNRITKKSYSNINYYLWNHNGDYECIKTPAGVCVDGSEGIAKLLWDYNGNTRLDMVENPTSNFSTTLNTRVVNLKQDTAVFKKLLSMMGITETTGDEYLILEPTVAIMKNSSSPYYYGTVYDLYMNVLKNKNETGISGVKEFLFTRLGNAMYSTKFSIGNVTAFKKTKPSTSKVTFDKWGKNAYGVAIYKVSDILPPPSIKCKIGVNNNKDSKYNWLTYDNNTQQMVPVSGGCCSTYSKYGITENQVKQNYPQCFDSPCTEQINTNATQCNNNSKGVASKKQILTANYCYAGRKYYTGVIDSNNLIFYGCTYSDSLSLPQGYKNNLTLGSNFIWPTNEELLNESPIDLDYEITRTSTATCYAYKVDKSTGYTSAYNVSNLNFDNIKSKIKEKVKFEKIKIEQNSIETGNLEGKIDSVDVIINENSTGLFDIRVNSSYNQILDVEQNSHSYRYFDNTDNKYLRYSDIKDKTKIKNYDVFSTMIMPVDNKFNVKNNYQYGLSYSTSFGGVKMSGAYNCTQKVTGDSPPCICPEGTENAGLDLSNYSKSNAGTNGKCSVSSDSECAILQDEYCNNRNISYKCPNIDYDLTECINQKMNANSKKTKVKAYNECVYEKCNCSSDDCDYKKICGPSEDDRTIYRTIFLDNPFVNNTGSARIPGTNWGGEKSLDDSGNYTGLVKKYIIDTGKYMYDKEPMYSINLTPKAIGKVREYNNSNKYDYFNLECDDTNGRCYSVFLHKNITEYVSGTCGSIDNKEKFYEQFYSCRENSFKQ